MNDRDESTEQAPVVPRDEQRDVAVPRRTMRDLLAAEDEGALLLATIYEIGGMAVVA